ncbi:MAG TPA: hypothetical protein VHV83_14320 [Armatimonadota bacterium]|nr:hypothetical protein [Armatimonadota bacterium]
MGLIGLVVILVLSVMHFSDLGLKKVLIFNAIFFGLFFLPAFGIPSWAVITGQYFTIGGLYIATRLA